MRNFNRLTFLTLAAFNLLSHLDTALAQTPIATPNPVNFNVQTGGSAPSQNVNITLSGASVTVVSVSATTNTGQNWLLPSVGSSSVFVSVNAAGLSAGTYSGTVTANTSAGTLSFTVNLTVSAAPTLNANPTALNFAFQTGTTAPLAQTISLTSSGGAANATITSSTSSGGTQWLIVTPTGQVTTPTPISINIQPAGLAAGVTYTGNIQIVPAGGGSTINVPVSLVVSNNPIIAANPASFTFTAQVGTGAPSQSLSLSSSGAALAYTATSSVGSPPGGSWLAVPNQSGNTPAAISVGVNPAGLAVGTYIGVINITAPNAGNGSLSVPVTLNITPGPVLQLGAPALSFAYQTGQSQPLSQTVAVGSASGQVGFTASAQTNTGGQWLNVSPANGTAPGNIVVSVNTTGLAPATYTGSISVTATGSNTPETIPVKLVVSNTALFALSPGSATFTATAGSVSSSFQNVAITSTDGSALSFSVAVSTTTGANWLLVNTSSGSTPANLSISANPAGLAVGTYTGTVTITSSGSVANSPQAVPVTLNVLSSNTLNVSSSSLTFTQAQGGAAPAAQTVNVTSSGAASGGQITFSAAVTLNQGQGWLTVSPTNATTPATLTVTANGSGLAAGTYTGQIILSSPGVAQQTVGVTLNVGSTGGFNTAGSITHLASAGGWKTIITLVNTGTAPAQARLNFFGDNGQPLPLPLTFPQISPAVAIAPVTTLDRTLSAGATLIIETTGPDTQVTQGWAQLLTTGSITGYSVFRQSVVATGNQQEAVVALETRNLGAYLLTFDNTAGFATGVAVANVSTQTANIQVVIRDDNGVVLQSNSLTVPGQGHTAFDLAVRFAITAQRRGTIEFQTPAGGQISLLAIRFNPAFAFSTVPALAK